MSNAVTYAEYEKSQQIGATYFIQTKYIRDFNDDIFFDDKGVVHLKKLVELGMDSGHPAQSECSSMSSLALPMSFQPRSSLP